LLLSQDDFSSEGFISVVKGSQNPHQLTHDSFIQNIQSCHSTRRPLLVQVRNASKCHLIIMSALCIFLQGKVRLDAESRFLIPFFAFVVDYINKKAHKMANPSSSWAQFLFVVLCRAT